MLAFLRVMQLIRSNDVIAFPMLRQFLPAHIGCGKSGSRAWLSPIHSLYICAFLNFTIILQANPGVSARNVSGMPVRTSGPGFKSIEQSTSGRSRASICFWQTLASTSISAAAP